jgi:hypothetical protein
VRRHRGRCLVAGGVDERQAVMGDSAPALAVQATNKGMFKEQQWLTK